MTKKETINLFLNYNKSFSDYWSMQYAWTCFVDSLIKDKQINGKRAALWGNPCTPETFKAFNKKFKGLN